MQTETNHVDHWSMIRFSLIIDWYIPFSYLPSHLWCEVQASQTAVVMGRHWAQVTVDPNIFYGILLTETGWIDHDCKTVPAGQRQLKSQTKWQQSCLGRWQEQSLEVCSRWWTTWWKTGGSIESRSHFQLSQNQVPVSASQRSSSRLKWHDNTKGLYEI